MATSYNAAGYFWHEFCALYTTFERFLMATLRPIKKVMKGKPTLEGAGVHLKRAFGFQHVPQLDPFLLLDDFHSDNPADYVSGFPRHLHWGSKSGIMWGFQLWANCHNTQEELKTAFEEYHDGTFIKNN
jgi:redox-sensitive bicupin YhaK (pirin superfamily)